MLKTMSVNALLKSLIAVLSILVTVLVANGAWDTWRHLVVTERVASVADISAQLFGAMNNLRFDRSRTGVALSAEAAADDAYLKSIEKFRTDELAALKNATDLLRASALASGESAVAALDKQTANLRKLHDEARAAAAQPKTARRPDLAKELSAQIGELLETIDRAGHEMVAEVKNADAFVDQLLILKDMAWTVRDVGGNASALITAANGNKVDAATMRKYYEYIGGARSSWSGVEAAVIGDAVPADLRKAVADAKAGYFGTEYTSARDRVMDALSKGEKPEMDTKAWGDFNMKSQDLLVVIAVKALDAANNHADAQQSAARFELLVRALLVVLVVALSVGGSIAISHRVLTPILRLGDAMRRLAAGDLTVETAYAGRGDEIGGFADAFDIFRRNAIEKERIEAEQKQAREARERRAQLVEKAIAEFEEEVLHVLSVVSHASGTLKDTAQDMTGIADNSARQATDVAAASQQSSSNVQAVAAASEELAFSIKEIGQQVVASQSIARQAVHEAEMTNTTVNSLVEASARVDNIVTLIQSIASQTNLLALNATIEAARAGEAGKGFAVVANEVKHLANQTAQATEQISQQIQSMQASTTEAAKAIKGIGGTIVRIDEIATTIAAAVEEQNAATLEIARNVDQAAKGTEKVNGSIGAVTEAAEQTGGAAKRVFDASAEMAGQADQIRSHVADFLQRIRMA
jgi:methyl-accepting chemotaxis protein